MSGTSRCTTHTEQLLCLLTRLLLDMRNKRLPERRQLRNPRIAKRKISDFPLKRLEHFHPPLPTCSLHEAVLSIWKVVGQDMYSMRFWPETPRSTHSFTHTTPPSRPAGQRHNHPRSAFLAPRAHDERRVTPGGCGFQPVSPFAPKAQAA